jgi:NAD(P)-dependent dehydrogenase (short-subunit alcohol dehydrogenase family)
MWLSLSHRLDLADLQSVRSFAKQQQQELQSSRRPLRVLVNNAGRNEGRHAAGSMLAGAALLCSANMSSDPPASFSCMGCAIAGMQETMLRTTCSAC